MYTRVLATVALLAGAAISPAQSITWVNPKPPAAPSARCCAGMAYDFGSGASVLFSGTTSVGPHGDTWIWQNSTWSQLSPATSPPAREGPGMVYDAAAQNIVMFGGKSASGESLNDTWTWDGTTWTQQFPAVSPPGRRFDTQGMAFDAATHTVIFFGGIDSQGNTLDDTWTWNGITMTWKQHNPASKPSRRRTMIAYDAVAKNVVLFGGDTGNGDVEYNDTWTWDGATWTEQSPSTSPPARVDGAIAFDPVLGGVVLFGGFSQSYVDSLNDTWLWDGSNWTETQPIRSPPARYSSSMDYDPRSHTLVLFGGFSPGPALGDTWVLTLAP